MCLGRVEKPQRKKGILTLAPAPDAGNAGLLGLELAEDLLEALLVKGEGEVGDEEGGLRGGLVLGDGPPGAVAVGTAATTATTTTTAGGTLALSAFLLASGTTEATAEATAPALTLASLVMLAGLTMLAGLARLTVLAVLGSVTLTASTTATTTAEASTPGLTLSSLAGLTGLAMLTGLTMLTGLAMLAGLAVLVTLMVSTTATTTVATTPGLTLSGSGGGTGIGSVTTLLGAVAATATTTTAATTSTGGGPVLTLGTLNTRGALGAGPGNLHVERPAVKLLLVELLDGTLGEIKGLEVDEAVAKGAAPPAHDMGLDDLSGGGEVALEGLVGVVVGNVGEHGNRGAIVEVCPSLSDTQAGHC